MRVIDQWTDEEGFEIRLREDDPGNFFTQMKMKASGQWGYISESPTLPPRVKQLVATLRVLAGALVKAASGSLEGPDIEDPLAKAGLIAWTKFDSTNADHRALDCAADMEDGDAVWLLTDFGREVLKH